MRYDIIFLSVDQCLWLTNDYKTVTSLTLNFLKQVTEWKNAWNQMDEKDGSSETENDGMS